METLKAAATWSKASLTGGGDTKNPHFMLLPVQGITLFTNIGQFIFQSPQQL